jgi:predicted dehydrogenase
MPDSSSAATRRGFLKTSAGASLFGALAAATPVHAGVDETIRVGLVGCGGRGTGAAIDALTADAGARLVAVADTFKDRIDLCFDQINAVPEVAPRAAVAPDHVFVGFDAYKQLIDSDVDLVLLATPPHFRAEHLEYAVQAGKHTFVEKPVGVDVPSVERVRKACLEAEKKHLAVVSGLCWRYDLGARETVRRVLEEKAVGDIIAIESSYNGGSLWHRGDKPEWSRMEYQIRNWLYFCWLSGDHILEQAVHSLDKTAWLLGDQHPTSAMALGGRQQRTDPQFGNVYDHFSVFYEYPGGKHVYFTCRQQAGCDAQVDERVLGDKGQAQIIRHVITDRAGKRTWKYKGPQPSMYTQEHEALFKSIRQGKPINNGHYMCNSTMIALLGRAAAYTGKTITWDELLKSTERLGPAEYSWTDFPVAPVPIPGKTAFA